MKYVIIRCEDRAPRGGDVSGLLEGAKMPHLLQLAQAGSGGVIQARSRTALSDLHAALLGLNPDDPEAATGRWYAAQANLQLSDGEIPWCCDLVTAQENRIVDPGAGHIPTAESRLLIQALNGQLGSETRRWEVGADSRHILIVRGKPLADEPPRAVRPPDAVAGTPWRRALPKGAGGMALQALIEQAAKILEAHPVNRVRLDLGENPANLIWLWGPAIPGPGKSFRDRTGLSGAVVSDGFPMRGLAQSLGLTWKTGSADLEERTIRKLSKTVSDLISQHDLVYVPLQVRTANPVDRLCAMERLDQLVLKPLTHTLPDLGPWRLAVVVGDQRSGCVPFVAIGTGLPSRPALRLAAEPLAERGLVFDDGAALYAWLTQHIA